MGIKKNIGIISMGLIGGSVLKSLIKHDFNFVCVTHNLNTKQKLQELNVEVSEDLCALKKCEIIFLCSPMRNILQILDELESVVSADTIVCDVASLKEFVTQKTRPYKFIPTHPMAGKETSGFDVSCDDLFTGAKWVITPFKNTLPQDLEIVEKIISLTGAKTIIANSKEHDEAVALISHFPLVLSQALMKSVEDNNLAKKLASSGFRDMTRLALSSVVMACDMVEFNHNNICNSMKKVFENTENLFSNYDNAEIEKIKADREKMYSKDGKNLV